jgi:hypothetical protein
MPYDPTLTTWLSVNACDDLTATGLTDLRTGATVYGGALNLGMYFDLTEVQARQLSFLTNGTLHAGRYRRVQVDSGAVQGAIRTGAIGLMVAGLQPELNIVTSYGAGIPGCHPVIFLNRITTGRFGFVQELGIATVLCGPVLTIPGATGSFVNSVNGAAPPAPFTLTGVLDVPAAQTDVNTSMGIALDPPGPNRLIRVQLKLPVLQG